MDHSRLQFSVSGLLISVACVAVNVWLFRLGPIWGILALNVTKHVVIASLCQRLGIDKTAREGPPPRARATAAKATVP